MSDYTEPEIKELVGKTPTKVTGRKGGEELSITCDDGTTYVFYHSQECSGSAYIESITGNLKSLVGNPILIAEESTNSESNPDGASEDAIEYQDSFTWTFYKFATIKGHVDVRWYGSSNGYYSEEVELRRVNADGTTHPIT